MANGDFPPLKASSAAKRILQHVLGRPPLPLEKRREMFESTAAQLPVRKIGQPDDIAKAVLFLMTTTYATGSTVRVDGGGGHSVGSRRRMRGNCFKGAGKGSVRCSPRRRLCANRIQNEIHCFAQILPVRGGGMTPIKQRVLRKANDDVRYVCRAERPARFEFAVSNALLHEAG